MINAEARWLRNHHLQIARLDGRWPLWVRPTSITKGFYVAVYQGKWGMSFLLPSRSVGISLAAYVPYSEFVKSDCPWHFITDEEAEKGIVEAALFENNWANIIGLREHCRSIYPLQDVELHLQSKKRSHR